MLSDSSLEIRQQADAALSEFLQEIKNSPVSSNPPVCFF
jgi:vacuole morphology and inheritance protein 14